MASELCRERILSEDYYDFILSDFRTRFLTGLSLDEACIQDAGMGFQCVYLPSSVADPITVERFSYNAIPKCYALLDMEALNQAGILQVQNYPTLQLMGEGIMIGFIDSGIDYTNSIFRNLDGSTRIISIWDQTIQSGDSPEGLDYGTEYTEEMINLALQSENPTNLVETTDEIGHGTFVASVAAGGADVEQQFLGAAPEASLVVVKLKQAKQYLRDYYFIREDTPCYQENDILLGVRYLHQVAQRRNMPLVICIALGTNMGGHTQALPLSYALNMYALMPNRVVVVGGGNESNQRHHFYGEVEASGESQNVDVRVGEDVTGFVMELWTNLPNIYSISITSPSGESTRNLPIRSNGSTEFQFLLDRTIVSVDYRILVERTNAELIYFRFIQPTSGIWRLTVNSVQRQDGEYHIWLPMTEFLTNEVYYLESNPYTTITSPGNAENVLTTAFYNGADNSIDIQSGRGYTREKRIKPDITAPGVNVSGGLPEGGFTRRSGSSISAGITAGASALLVEWSLSQYRNTSVNTNHVKGFMILSAGRQQGLTYPNREWGYGTLDLYEVFEVLRQF